MPIVADYELGYHGFFKKAGKFFARAVPAAVGGYITGGYIGAAAGTATGFIGGKNKPLKRFMYGIGAGGLTTGAGGLITRYSPGSKLGAFFTKHGQSPFGFIRRGVSKLTGGYGYKAKQLMKHRSLLTPEQRNKYSPKTQEVYPSGVKYLPQTNQLVAPRRMTYRMESQAAASFIANQQFQTAEGKNALMSQVMAGMPLEQAIQYARVVEQNTLRQQRYGQYIQQASIVKSKKEKSFIKYALPIGVAAGTALVIS
jgi:hypothetical protein